jgi:hypothetical protein
MLDTFIGSNDGVPFTIPGRKGFLKDMKEFKTKEIPAYIEAVEKPDDPTDAGTVARLGLKDLQIGGVTLTEVEAMKICKYPGKPSQAWDVEMEPIGDDSCVFLYWPYKKLEKDEQRDMAFTYGFGRVDISGGAGGGLALSAPSPVRPDSEFVVTAYVYGARRGDEVELQLPDAGLTLAPGESRKKTVDEGGARAAVFWKVRAGAAGTYKIQAASDKAKTKPYEIVVKSISIFG